MQSGGGWDIFRGYSPITWLVVANLAFRWARQGAARKGGGGGPGQQHAWRTPVPRNRNWLRLRHCLCSGKARCWNCYSRQRTLLEFLPTHSSSWSSP